MHPAGALHLGCRGKARQALQGVGIELGSAIKPPMRRSEVSLGQSDSQRASLGVVGCTISNFLGFWKPSGGSRIQLASSQRALPSALFLGKTGKVLLKQGKWEEGKMIQRKANISYEVPKEYKV